MIWNPFRKAKPAPLNPGPINEDWRAGDLAECINGAWGFISVGPDTGDVLKVVDIQVGIGFYNRLPGWGLALSGLDGYFAADQFRKVPPLNSTEQTEMSERIKDAAKHADPVRAIKAKAWDHLKRRVMSGEISRDEVGIELLRLTIEARNAGHNALRWGK